MASKRTAGSSSWGQKTPDTFTHTRTNSLILFLLKHLYSSFLFSFKKEGGKWHCFGLQNRCQFELYFASKYLVWLCGAWVEKYLPIPKRLSELAADAVPSGSSQGLWWSKESSLDHSFHLPRVASTGVQWILGVKKLQVKWVSFPKAGWGGGIRTDFTPTYMMDNFQNGPQYRHTDCHTASMLPTSIQDTHPLLESTTLVRYKREETEEWSCKVFRPCDRNCGVGI